MGDNRKKPFEPRYTDWRSQLLPHERLRYANVPFGIISREEADRYIGGAAGGLLNNGFGSSSTSGNSGSRTPEHD